MATSASRDLIRSARFWGDQLCIWRLCGHAACLRARACRGRPADCIPRCAPLVPQEARDFVRGLGDAQEKQWTFDQAIEEYGEEFMALEDWQRAVARSLAPSE